MMGKKAEKKNESTQTSVDDPPKIHSQSQIQSQKGSSEGGNVSVRLGTPVLIPVKQVTPLERPAKQGTHAPRKNITSARIRNPVETAAKAKGQSLQRTNDFKREKPKVTKRTNHGSPPRNPPSNSFVINFDCDKNMKTPEDICKIKKITTGTSEFEKILKEIIEELLSDPTQLPPLNHLLIQALVSFVIDGIMNYLERKTEKELTIKQKKMLTIVSNITISSKLITGKVPTVPTLIIKYNMKELMDYKGITPVAALVKQGFVKMLKSLYAKTRTVVDENLLRHEL